MSTVETTATPVPVEEVKPTETAPVTESPAPAVEAPKTEDVAAPVRLLLCVISLSLTPPPFFFLRKEAKEAEKAEVTEVGLLPFPLFLCSCVDFSPLSQEGAAPAASAEPTSDDAKPVSVYDFPNRVYHHTGPLG
jgi:hypothetical protein